MKSVSDKSNPKIKEIADKALRYDLTVPLARYVSQNSGKLYFPYKRYQIQPVWRADRPQKGRYREFLQCDADVVGSDSLWQEVEMIDLYSFVFQSLGISIEININNRKILAGIAEICGIENRLIEFTVVLDKIEKIGEEGVISELTEKGFSFKEITKLKPAFRSFENLNESIAFLKNWLNKSEQGCRGIEELEFVIKRVKDSGILKLNVSLARGLNYYTGCIFEVNALNVDIGSVGGGGRYDNLTAMFGLENISGVGISFGLDRIMLCLEELNLLPDDIIQFCDVVILRVDERSSDNGYKIAQELRAIGVSVDYYPDIVKIKKQFDYAEKRGASHVIIFESENDQDQIRVKNLMTGESYHMNRKELLIYFQDLKN
jgi:histidyl-tRNA synthetase